MKALTRTSILVIAVAGLMVLMVGTAMAAPPDMEMVTPLDETSILNKSQIDPTIFEQVEPAFPDGGDDEMGPDNPGDDNPGDDDGGQDDGQDTPGMDDGGQDGGDTVTPPANNNSGGETTTSKLPNTGTSLALLVAIALAIAGTAYVARRAANKRTR